MQCNRKYGNSLLITAAKCCRFHLVKMMVRRGADIAHRNHVSVCVWRTSIISHLMNAVFYFNLSLDRNSHTVSMTLQFCIVTINFCSCVCCSYYFMSCEDWIWSRIHISILLFRLEWMQRMKRKILDIGRSRNSYVKRRPGGGGCRISFNFFTKVG